MKRNVLCVFLSDLRPKSSGPEFFHSYCSKGEDIDCKNKEAGKCPKECEYYYTGYHTNEPCAKYVMNTLAKNNQKLDQILMICTKKVRETKVDKSDITALEFFKRAIQNYLKEGKQEKFQALYPEIIEEQEFFKVIKIEDAPNETQTYQYLSDVIDSIPNETNLYLDLNGGFRDAVYIMLALTQIMKQRGPVIKGCYHIPFNYKNDSSKPNFIQDKTFLFNTFNLISGNDEFFLYGSVRKLYEYYPELKNYEESTNDTDEKKLVGNTLKAMKEVSDDLKICSSSKIKDAISELKTCLDDVGKYNYAKTNQEIGNESRYRVFFSLLISIKEKYNKLSQFISEDNCMYLIKWCVENELIQQALTFYEDMVPKLLVDRKVVYWKNDTVKNKINKQCRFKPDTDSVEYKTINLVNKYFGSLIENKEIKKAKKKVDKVEKIIILLEEEKEEEKMLFSNLRNNNEQLFKDSLETYYELKQDRNNMAHGGKENAKLEDIIERLEKGIKQLEEITNSVKEDAVNGK